MESPTIHNSQATEGAIRWNRDFAGRVTRWKRLRLVFAVGLCGAGILAFLAESASLWSAPCLIAAFISFLLYLDSRDQLREIKARNSTVITPRIRSMSGPKPGDSPKTTSSA